MEDSAFMLWQSEEPAWGSCWPLSLVELLPHDLLRSREHQGVDHSRIFCGSRYLFLRVSLQTRGCQRVSFDFRSEGFVLLVIKLVHHEIFALEDAVKGAHQSFEMTSSLSCCQMADDRTVSAGSSQEFGLLHETVKCTMEAEEPAPEPMRKQQ